MGKKSKKNCDCSIRIILDMISNKWSLLVLYEISNHYDTKTAKPLRFNELFKRVEGISQKMLTQSLRLLQKDGFIKRTVYPVIPPKVEYSLTDLGISFMPYAEGLGKWATAHNSAILQARKQFEQKG